MYIQKLVKTCISKKFKILITKTHRPTKNVSLPFLKKSLPLHECRKMFMNIYEMDSLFTYSSNCNLLKIQNDNKSKFTIWGIMNPYLLVHSNFLLCSKRVNKIWPGSPSVIYNHDFIGSKPLNKWMVHQGVVTYQIL